MSENQKRHDYIVNILTYNNSLKKEPRLFNAKLAGVTVIFHPKIICVVGTGIVCACSPTNNSKYTYSHQPRALNVPKKEP